jgi:carbohydrate kinase (thermoresistant glucokinase family)
VVVILMGVSGSGKTTLGRALAGRIHCPFFDADDFHSAANRSKMARGVPLTDGDRADWLREISRSIVKWNLETPLAALACSALKQAYRETLAKGSDVLWICLKGTPELIAQRLARRQNHFFDPQLLASQIADFEEPAGAWVVDVSADVDTIVSGLIGHLKDIHVLR